MSPDKKSCLACPPGCAECDQDRNDCFSCTSQFYLSGKECRPCPKGCSSCKSPSNCTDCDYSYYPDSHKCLPCPDGCELCSNSTSCLRCLEGYWMLKSNSTECLRCPDSNCLKCSPYGCEECKENHFYNKSQMLCHPCEEKNCSKCDMDGQCYKCVNNTGTKFKLRDRRCDPVICKKDCIECTNSDDCQKCRKGRYLVLDYCVHLVVAILSSIIATIGVLLLLALTCKPSEEQRKRCPHLYS